MKKVRLKIVLDTNVVLSSLSDNLNYNAILDGLVEYKYDLYISNEVLLEYEEKIQTFFDYDTYFNFFEVLEILTNIHKVNPQYKFNTIHADPDDNKFIDCAFCSNADYLVTNDKHFLALKNVEFPKINVINIDEFMNILREL